MVALGDVMYDDVTLTYAQDSVDFPDLEEPYAQAVSYSVISNTFDTDDATITLKHTFHTDSIYSSMNGSVFPYTLVGTHGRIPIFVYSGAMKYQRLLLDNGTASSGSITVRRKIKVF